MTSNEALSVYFRGEGLVQPHWQLRSLQLQAPFSHPQEQLVQSVFVFESFIVVSLFSISVVRFHTG
jgi:hypothetical protein